MMLHAIIGIFIVSFTVFLMVAAFGAGLRFHERALFIGLSLAVMLVGALVWLRP
jgi:hypothetical protein